MGLFHILNESGSTKTATELASIIGGDKQLIGDRSRSCHARFQRLTLSSPHSEAIGYYTYSNRNRLRDIHRWTHF